METFVHKNMAILGDAAHAMTPFLGSGAGQAVEDAFILGTVLGHPNTTRETISRALEVYDTIRRPLALDVQARSRLSGRYRSLRLDGVSFENRTDREGLWEDLQRLATKSNEIRMEGSVQPYYEEAMRLLETVK